MKNFNNFRNLVTSTINDTLTKDPEIAPFIKRELSIADKASQEFVKENFEELGLSEQEISNLGVSVKNTEPILKAKTNKDEGAR